MQDETFRPVRAVISDLMGKIKEPEKPDVRILAGQAISMTHLDYDSAVWHVVQQAAGNDSGLFEEVMDQVNEWVADDQADY